MKKILFLPLLLLSLLVAPHTGFAQTPFDDIQSHQAAADIEAVYEKGIMIGTAANKFSPEDFVERAQLAVCLIRTFDLSFDDLELEKTPVPSDLYDDVEKDLWYSDAAMIAGHKNIFNIFDRKFRPRQAVTRLEAAEAITESFKAKNLSVVTTLIWPNYLDINNLTEKQQSAVGFIFNTGIMKYAGNRFGPDEKITRAELATILNQTLKTLAVATPAQEAEQGSSPSFDNPSLD